jgi:molybdenum cofactor biosynthesis protein B
VVTVSDTRTPQTDAGGDVARALLTDAGHPIAGSALVRDEREAIAACLETAAAAGARAVLFTGGTGIAPRDVTVEALEPLFTKHLPGFGELFRMLSFREIGSAAFLSRATAGTVKGLVVFALPGSPAAVRLGLSALVLPQLGHAVRELHR